MRAARSAAAAAFAPVAGLALVGQFRMPLTSDVAFHLDAARRLLDGAVLYRDVAAPETPCDFWASVPAALAGGSGPAMGTAFRCLTIALALAVLALIWREGRTAPALRPGYVLLSLVLPVWYFGTPEHLAFTLLVPHVAVALARLEARGVARWLAVAAGLLAAGAIALEPALAAVPLALTGLELALARPGRRRVGAEHAALGAGLVAAALLAAAGAPEFAERWPMLLGTLAALPHPPIAALLVRDIHAWTVWLALGAALAVGWRLHGRRRVAAYAVVTAAAFLAALVQRSGEGPDFFPATAFGVILLLELAAAEGRSGPRDAALRRVAAVVLLLPFLYLFGAVTWRRAHAVFTRTRAEQLAALRLMGSAPTSVAVLSADIADAYPGVLERGHRLVLRYPSFAAALLPEAHPARRRMLREYGEDLQRTPPAALVVRAPGERERRPGEPAVNYLDVLCEDEVARAALGRYRFAERAGGFELYRTDATGAAACGSS